MCMPQHRGTHLHELLHVLDFRSLQETDQASLKLLPQLALEVIIVLRGPVSMYIEVSLQALGGMNRYVSRRTKDQG
jgi:hypothetical protein